MTFLEGVILALLAPTLFGVGTSLLGLAFLGLFIGVMYYLDRQKAKRKK